jgi:hypothetical protein
MAFYEKAPLNIAASMKRGVEVFCRHDAYRIAMRTQHMWLCDGSRLNFLRGIDLGGYKHPSGFVCDDKNYPQAVRYYLSEMLDDKRHYFSSEQ